MAGVTGDVVLHWIRVDHLEAMISRLKEDVLIEPNDLGNLLLLQGPEDADPDDLVPIGYINVRWEEFSWFTDSGEPDPSWLREARP